MQTTQTYSIKQKRDPQWNQQLLKISLRNLAIILNQRIREAYPGMETDLEHTHPYADTQHIYVFCTRLYKTQPRNDPELVRKGKQFDKRIQTITGDNPPPHTQTRWTHTVDAEAVKDTYQNFANFALRGWRVPDTALCTQTDPDIFTPTGTRNPRYDQALLICLKCPVINQCRREMWKLEKKTSGAPQSVYGGADPRVLGPSLKLARLKEDTKQLMKILETGCEHGKPITPLRRETLEKTLRKNISSLPQLEAARETAIKNHETKIKQLIEEDQQK